MTKKQEMNLQSCGLADLQTTKTLTRHFVTPSPKGRGERTAFTLAEVLITLGIIGIVAAMTIPTLVANYQEKSWGTAATVFERKLTEALRVMNTQQTLAGHTTTQSFVDELAKHFKIVKTCDSNNLKNCVEENITWNVLDISNGGSESDTLNLANLKTAADLGKADWGTETIGVQFANGTTAIMAYDPSCRQDPYSNTVTGMSCISMIYDTSGGKSPNATSKDIRAYNNKIANCAFKSSSTCYGQPFKPEPITKAECENIKSSLGINKCYYDNDYWAGAIKTCGGTNNVTSSTDLAKIANYVYNTDVIEEDTDSDENYDGDPLILDNTKVSKLGLSGEFYLWASEEETEGKWASHRDFFQTSTIYYNDWSTGRSTSSRHAICVE